METLTSTGVYLNQLINIVMPIVLVLVLGSLTPKRQRIAEGATRLPTPSPSGRG